MLGAICDILQIAITAKVTNDTNVIDIAKVSGVLMDLLKNQGPNILTTLSIPKFSKMFILLMKLDNAARKDSKPELKWPTIMDDLLSLVQASSDVEHQKLYIRFIVKTLQIFEEEVVEKGSEANEIEFELRSRCKDFVREGPIVKIVELLSQVLNNGSVFHKNTIKGTMKLLSHPIVAGPRRPAQSLKALGGTHPNSFTQRT